MGRKKNPLLKKEKKYLQKKRKRTKTSSNKNVILDIKLTSYKERYQKSIELVNKLPKQINQKTYNKISSIIKICDMNEELMEKFLDYQFKNDFKSFSKNFTNYMFIISKNKRNEFQNSLNKMKHSISNIHFKKNSMKKVFENLLYEIFKNYIYDIKDFQKLKNSNNYFVDKKKYIFPLYKGNYESQYAYYIYLFFQYILDNNYFNRKVILLHDFLELIFSNDFQEHFKKKEELLIFMYQYMFISFFCVEMSKGEIVGKDLFLNYFFEPYSLKKNKIEEMMKRLKIKKNDYSLTKDLLIVNIYKKKK